jgi:hypothetical protein
LPTDASTTDPALATRPTAATDFTLILPDVVGSLAACFGQLGEAGVNVIGHAGFIAWAGEGVLHLMADDPDAAREALAKAGVEVREERQVLVVPLNDRPGTLAGVLRQVAASGANVDLTYVTADGRAVIGVNDLQRALARLQQDSSQDRQIVR